jgi:hypothetical protein
MRLDRADSLAWTLVQLRGGGAKREDRKEGRERGRDRRG